MELKTQPFPSVWRPDNYMELYVNGEVFDDVNKLCVNGQYLVHCRDSVVEEILDVKRDTLALEVLESTVGQKNSERRLADWLTRSQSGVDHWHSLVADIRASGKIDLAMLSVAMREIRALARNAHH